MFSDSIEACAEFLHIQKAERQCKEASQQTDQLSFSVRECQSTFSLDQQVQTDDSHSQDTAYATYNPSQVLEFLTRVTPSVLKYLDENLQSHAFDRYDLEKLLDRNGDKIQKLHILTQNALPGEVKCSGICWNASGSVIGVSYCALDHEGWCTHNSGLAFWNLNRRDFSPNKPNKVLETAACVSALQFHPVKPALVAGGDYNGQICLWSLSHEDDLPIAKTKSDETGHSESITALLWVTGQSGTSDYQIASSSLDGKVLIWEYNERTSQLTLIKGFLILSDYLPKVLKSSKLYNGEVGVTCMCFNYGDPSIFFLGLEGGGIVQCSTESQVLIPGKFVGKIQLISPKNLAFNPHSGFVNDISCAPFGHHLIATSGADAELRIYSTLQPREPLLTVHCSDFVTSMAWSPVRPIILCAVTSKCELLIYNLQTAHTEPIFREASSERNLGFCDIQFNKKDYKLLAAGDSSGAVHIWQLTDEYASYNAHEHNLLKLWK